MGSASWWLSGTNLTPMLLGQWFELAPRFVFSVWLTADIMKHICPKSATRTQFLQLFFDSFLTFSKDQMAGRLLKA